MLTDLRYAFRNLVRSPSFTVAAVSTLALGIAANTIVFTLINSLLLRPLTVPAASRIVRLAPVDDQGRVGSVFSRQDYAEYRAQAQGFETLAAYIPAELTIGRSSSDRLAMEAHTALGYIVSSSYFDLVGMKPSLGRPFTEADERDGSAPAAIITHTMWQRRFAADPSVLGATLLVNGRPFTIVGVGPPDFRGTEPIVMELWVPLSAYRIASPDGGLAVPGTERLLVIGRLRPDASRASAEASLGVIARRLSAAFPDENRPQSVQLSIATFFKFLPSLRPFVAVVMAIVGLVLVIACANVMNLTLARATARQREIAVRVAIGAARWRIVRHLVAETLLVSMVAGAAGLLLSMWILRALYTIGQELWPFPWAIALSLTPDVRVFTYTFGIAASAGLAFGLVPAWQMSAPGVTAALHDEGRMLGLRLSRSGIRRALVVLQLAACVVLLVAAGLLARGLRSARAFEFGFAPQHVVYAEYNLRRAGYSSVQAAVFTSELRARMERTPGVATVAFTSHIPLHGGVRRSNVRLADDDGSRKEPLSSLYSVVSPEYFDVMSIPVVAGRNFVGDAPADVSAVVISEGIARKFWPGSSAVGKTIVIEPVKGPLTVVGVVRDAAGAALWRDKEMSLYLPLRQSADMRDMRVLVRTSGDTAAAAGALRRHAAAIDGGVALDAAPLETLLKFWMLPSRGAAIGATALGLVALAMASIGIYGVLAFTVTHRTREIGVRMALGADAADVRRLILRDGLVLIAMGLAAGIICARLAAPVLSGLLFDVKASDPLTFTIVPALLAAVALAACYVPARRASKLEPLTALRVE